MERNIFIVNATQIVTSESHPEGLFSVRSGFPKTFDSINCDDNIEAAMKAAKSAYFAQLGEDYANANPARVMTTVTLEIANGEQILKESIGSIPIPEPEGEPEEDPEEPVEE